MKSNLINVICDGSMKAAVEIADRKGILKTIDAKAVCDALRIEVKNGYELAVEQAKEALDALGEKWAQASLSASCAMFAQNALTRCGYMEESNARNS